MPLWRILVSACPVRASVVIFVDLALKNPEISVELLPIFLRLYAHPLCSLAGHFGLSELPGHLTQCDALEAVARREGRTSSWRNCTRWETNLISNRLAVLAWRALRVCGRSRVPASIAPSKRRRRTRSPVVLARSGHVRTRNWPDHIRQQIAASRFTVRGTASYGRDCAFLAFAQAPAVCDG